MYLEYPPHPALAPYVECLWTSNPRCGDEGRRSAHRILPDGAVDILFDGVDGKGFAGNVVGTMSRALVLPCDSSPKNYVAVRFRAGMAGRFLGGAEIAALTDNIVDLAAVGLSEANRLAVEFDALRRPKDQVDRLERYLLGRLPQASKYSDPVVEAVVKRIASGAGSARIEDLAAFAGVTRQHLRRRFAAAVGLPPKLYARIVRFRALIASTNAERPPHWAELAHDLGYSDQAHLCRDFKEFSGLSPGAWCDERPARNVDVPFVQDAGNPIV